MTALGMLVAVPAAQAVDISVNTTADEYGGSPASCSLREAITAAQTNAAFDGCSAGLGSDVVKIPAGTYKITRAGDEEDGNVTGDFDVTGTNALVIEPATNTDKVVVDANALDRAFDQQGINSLAIHGLDVKGGKTTGIGDDGGAIRNAIGALSIDATTVSSSNTNYSGGGIAVYSALAMINSTVSGNSAMQSGGGLYFPGNPAATVRSSTITANVADSEGDGTGDGGGFFGAATDPVNFTNVINAGNQDLSPNPGDKSPDCASGPFYFARFVLSNQAIGSGTCLVAFPQPSNKVVADAEIGPLADNGGPAPTHALILGSPAIGAGGSTAPDQCPATDQTGRDRPAGACDIGAVQYIEPTPPPVDTFGVKFSKIKPKPLKLKRGKKAKAVSVKVTSTGTGAATGVRVCVQPARKAKKSIKLVGKFCRKPGTLSASKTVKFKFKAKKKARKKLFKLKVVMTSTNAAQKTSAIKVKVK